MTWSEARDTLGQLVVQVLPRRHDSVLLPLRQIQGAGDGYVDGSIIPAGAVTENPARGGTYSTR